VRIVNKEKGPMFRQYENPYTLEKRLEELLKKQKDNPDDVDLAVSIAELKDRINFAWQDDEEDY
jgi:hypothetical protein